MNKLIHGLTMLFLLADEAIGSGVAEAVVETPAAEPVAEPVKKVRKSKPKAKAKSKAKPAKAAKKVAKAKKVEKKDGRGRPRAFEPAVERHVAALLRKFGSATVVQKILAAAKGTKFFEHRDAKLIPTPIKVTLPTITKVAERAEITLTKGRRSAEAQEKLAKKLGKAA
jgi:hypothetical protein